MTTPGAQFHCAWLTAEPTNYTNGRTYSVFRRAQSQTGNTTTWGVYLDDVQKLSVNIGFDVANVLVGGEFNCIPCQTSTAQFYGWYGDARSWQTTTSEGGVNWINVTSWTTTDTDSNWIIGTSASPFAIDHN